jgi:transcriptional regulator with XRE-family HTH domain
MQEVANAMSSRTTDKVTGRLIAAARALAGISQADFAEVAGLPPRRIGEMEAGGSARLHARSDIAAVRSALEHFGVLIVDEADGMGAGVRLKFTRQDVRQIARLEDEGGIIGSDDAP